MEGAGEPGVRGGCPNPTLLGVPGNLQDPAPFAWRVESVARGPGGQGIMGDLLPAAPWTLLLRLDPSGPNVPGQLVAKPCGRWLPIAGPGPLCPLGWRSVGLEERPAVPPEGSGCLRWGSPCPHQHSLCAISTREWITHLWRCMPGTHLQEPGYTRLCGRGHAGTRDYICTRGRKEYTCWYMRKDTQGDASLGIHVQAQPRTRVRGVQSFECV